jgi:hypothetical protein
VSAEYVHSDLLGLFVEGGLLTALPALAGWGIRIRASWPALRTSDGVEGRAARVLFGTAILTLYEFPLRDPGILALVLLALWASRRLESLGRLGVQ